MRSIKYVFLVLMCFSFVIEATEIKRGIEVTGKASIKSAPDVFIAKFGVQERHALASTVKLLVDDKANMLVKYAQSLGIKDKDIQSAIVNVYPIYEKPSITVDNVDVYKRQGGGEYSKVTVNNNSQQESNLIYQASRTITIKLNDINDYEKLLDRASKIGISRVYPLELTFSNAEALYQQALEQAIVNAKDKAEKLAKQTLRRLDKIIYLKESSYGAPGNIIMATESKSTRFAPMVGEKDIKAQVTVVFSLK